MFSRAAACYIVFAMVASLSFKQKTAYDVRISDWSSYVCSSDLLDQNLVGGRDSVWSRFVQLIAQTQRACPIRISLRLAAGNLGPDGPPVFRRNAANFSRICPPIILTFERRDLWGKVIA